MENLPPFYVGQRVVAIYNGVYRNDKTTAIKKGEVFTVLELIFCGCKWRIDVGKRGTFTGKSTCPDCKSTYQANGDIVYALADMFAPINENFQSITLEKVLETETPLISVN